MFALGLAAFSLTQQGGPHRRGTFVQAGDGKIGDTAKHIGEPRLWVDVVEMASRDDGEHDGGTIGPTLGTGEGPVSTPEGNSSQRALGRIVRETNPAIVEETGKAIPALQHVIDRLDHLGRFAERGALPFQPRVHVIEQRLALFLPRGQSFCDICYGIMLFDPCRTPGFLRIAPTKAAVPQCLGSMQRALREHPLAGKIEIGAALSAMVAGVVAFMMKDGFHIP